MDIDSITVVVPTKNEVENVGPFLASLDPRVRLVVVDASTDHTRELIRELRPENTVVRYEEGHVPRARNVGTELAETEWVLYTDADMSLGENYWSAWEALDLGPEVGAVQGGKFSADEHYQTYYKLFTLGIQALSWLTVPGGSGSNMIFRRRAILDVGGFDPGLTANEDIDALWRVRKAGWRIPFAPGLKVFERDHRRLDQGRLKKTVHGWVRPLLLFTGVGAERVRGSSWGYWTDSRDTDVGDGPLGGPPG